jgi:hypothetical protein
VTCGRCMFFLRFKPGTLGNCRLTKSNRIVSDDDPRCPWFGPRLPRQVAEDRHRFEDEADNGRKRR